ncbi:MAG TPA: YafY family protein [Chloroflexia bacterium]|nr:YafY family protein [Chloroflexia bacterium]
MNRTDRLLAIVLELRARHYTRAEDLAGQFEVSVRTIYRDVLALCEAGVPVVSTPGYGYALAPGYFLPPLMLTADEAGMLLLGAAFVAEQVDAPYRGAVDQARKKIDKLLPEPTRREVEVLQDWLRFVGRGRREPALDARLGLIREAIQAHDVLQFTYQTRHGAPGTRQVEPHGLVCVDGRWIMGAYCRTREAVRAFRLDRMDDLRRLDERFTRRPELSVRTFRPVIPGTLEVRALFTPDTIRWAREEGHYSVTGEEPHPEGTVLILRPREVAEVLPWLLSWGPGVRVLAPPAVQRQLAQTARAVVALYDA